MFHLFTAHISDVSSRSLKLCPHIYSYLSRTVVTKTREKIRSQRPLFRGVKTKTNNLRKKNYWLYGILLSQKSKQKKWQDRDQGGIRIPGLPAHNQALLIIPADPKEKSDYLPPQGGRPIEFSNIFLQTSPRRRTTATLP